jgi:probable addiction module antidote protein
VSKEREGFSAFDAAEYLKTPKARAEYIRAVWEESPGNVALMASALGDVARAIGMSALAEKTDISRKALYKALSPEGNPEFSTLLKVMEAFGVRLTVAPARPVRKVAAAKRATSPKRPAARRGATDPRPIA